MEAYQERVADEHGDLAEKLKRLEALIASDKYAEVSLQDRSYLEEQLPYMQGYLQVLNSRMEIAKTKTNKTPAPKAVVEKLKAEVEEKPKVVEKPRIS